MKLNILCVVALAGISAAAEIKVTPVQKVLQLMGNMLVKGKEAKKKEQVENTKSVGFCVDTISVKSLAIGDAEDTIAELTSTIDKATADIQKLRKGITKLQKDESTFDADIKAADKVRKNQKADYDVTLADYEESIDAIGRAITSMMGQKGDKAQATFLQVSSLNSLNSLNLMPESAKKALNIFLQQGTDDHDNVLLQDLAASAPEAAGYESQSNGVIDMLKKLQSKFVAEKTELETAEKNQVNSFNMLKQDLTLQLENAKKVRGEKEATENNRKALRTEKTKDRTDATKIMNEDSKYLSEVKANCATEKAEFEDRQKMRTEEIEALQKAVDVISSGAVSGSADKHLPKLLQQAQPEATSLAWLRSSVNAELLEQQQLQVQRSVAQFLQAQARKTDSKILSAVARRVAADPMKKVKKMITDMITKLTEQAASEATKKGQCDSDMAANKKTRIAKTEASDTLTAEIERLASKITKTTDAIASLTHAVEELDRALEQQTTIRETNTVNNKATIEDAEGAQKAVAQALTVLQDFYNKAGESAASFLQISEEPTQSGESQGVIGLLEVIQSDFARLESETKATENDEKKKYDAFVEDTKADKTSKTAEIEHKGDVKVKATEDKQVAEGDLKDEETALTDALATFEKLKKACIAKPMSYEERVARRNAEIANLKEALTMLEAETTEDNLRAGDTQANQAAL